MNRPNILFLLSDQHSPLAMSCAGHPVVRTPHMDRLSREGVQLDAAYCPTPLCMPARVSLLCARHAHNTGILHNGGRMMAEPTVPQALRAAGYRTAVTGKIHFTQRGRPGSTECDEHLRELGFEDVMANLGKVAAARSQQPDTYQAELRRKGVYDAFRDDYEARYSGGLPNWYVAESTLNDEDYHDAWIGRQTRDWLASYDDERPFFCWCNWGGPHMPWDAPGRYARLYDPAAVDAPLHDPLDDAPADIRRKRDAAMAGMPPDIWEVGGEPQPLTEEAWRRCRAHYYGMVNVVDDGIGIMLDALEQRGMLDNTLVVYTSDHGEMLYDRGLYGKQLMYEQSARVPLVVRWPRGFDAADRSQALASTLDLMATFLDVGGASLPVDHGRSLLPVLRGDTAAHRDEVFCELDAEKMVRQGPWKYVYHPEREVQQLFHLDDDPHELRNLAATGDHTGKEQALRDRILAWMIDTEPRPHGVRQPAR